MLKGHCLHLLVSDLYPGDAIGNFVLAIHDTLVGKGFSTRLYSERFDESLLDVSPYSVFFEVVRPNDTLLYQLSNHDPALSDIMAVSCRKVLYYHNITPGAFFSPYSLETASLLDKGRAELPLVAHADALLANSHYSLAEVATYLSPSTPRFFFPPFLRGQLSDFTSLEPVASRPDCVPQQPYLLTLGRVVPHKRVGDAIRIFSLLRSDLPNMYLVVAGSLYEPYAEELMKSVAECPALEDHVLFMGKLAQRDVAGLLRNATGLLHTSAHEGFCLPVLEAMLAGIPVFAHSQEAVVETLGGAGVLFNLDDPEQAAQSIKASILDAPQRKRLLYTQSLRAKALVDLADADSLFTFLGLMPGQTVDGCQR